MPRANSHKRVIPIRDPAGKASLSSSPLSRPLTPIHSLVGQFQSWLHFPDPTPIYVLMGAVAANLIEGIPVWMMLIGPPSSGKSDLLKSLMGIPNMREGGSITGESALLSGVGKKDRDKDSTGGLLREIGTHGGLVINEFTAILSIPHEPLGKLLSALRQVYDGYWLRRIGEGGGRALEWGPGKIGGFAGCTEAIDDHHKVMSDMGERWVFYRFPSSTGYQESHAAINRTSNPADMTLMLKDVVGGFFDGLGLGWPQAGQGFESRRHLTTYESNKLIAISQLASRCRSAVIRNERREVERVPMPERSPRMAGVMAQLYLGLERIGLEEWERWGVVRKVAVDCMPQTRKQVLEGVVGLQYGVGSTLAQSLPNVQPALPGMVGKPVVVERLCGINDFIRVTRCSEASTRRAVEDLEIHGVLEMKGGGGKRVWGLGREVVGWIEEGWVE